MNNEKYYVSENKQYKVRVKFEQGKCYFYYFSVADSLNLFVENRDKFNKFAVFMINVQPKDAFVTLKEIEELIFMCEDDEFKDFQYWFVCELLPQIEKELEERKWFQKITSALDVQFIWQLIFKKRSSQQF